MNPPTPTAITAHPTLRQFIDSGLNWPGWTDEQNEHQRYCLAENFLYLREIDGDNWLKQERELAAIAPNTQYRDLPGNLWREEYLADPHMIDEVIAALPADLVEREREMARSITRPAVLEVAWRDKFICTALGVEGSGWCAIVRRRDPDYSPDEGAATISLDALRQAVKVIEERNAE